MKASFPTKTNLFLTIFVSFQIKYFMDPAVHALQYLDVIQMKDTTHKSHFYHSLKGALISIPKVRKIEFHIPATLSPASRKISRGEHIFSPVFYKYQILWRAKQDVIEAERKNSKKDISIETKLYFSLSSFPYW